MATLQEIALDLDPPSDWSLLAASESRRYRFQGWKLGEAVSGETVVATATVYLESSGQLLIAVDDQPVPPSDTTVSFVIRFTQPAEADHWVRMNDSVWPAVGEAFARARKRLEALGYGEP